MKPSSFALALVFLAGAAAQDQPTRRIAVYSFVDIYTSTGAQVGQKLADRLLSKLADSSVYQVIDRQFLEQVMREQQLPTGRFDASTAVRIGKLVNVAAVVDGTITTATANPRFSEDSVGYYGTVTIAATARLISTETGTILKAPVASETAKGIVQVKPPLPPQPTCRIVPILGRSCSPGKVAPPPSVETKTMDQLVGEAIEACARSLAINITAVSSSVATSSMISANSPASSAANVAVVVGVSDGLTYINKGLGSGLKAGQVLQVYRVSVVPGLTDPDSGKPLTRKNPVCTLTLSDVEDSNASGKCIGNAPASRDSADIGSSLPASGAGRK